MILDLVIYNNTKRNNLVVRDCSLQCSSVYFTDKSVAQNSFTQLLSKVALKF